MDSQNGTIIRQPPIIWICIYIYMFISISPLIWAPKTGP